jgi:NitT/TauT family transport system ATP-binding protein
MEDRTEVSDMPKLSVKDLVITFENGETGKITEAVDGVTLDIKAGEFVSIVGLSGCGKTTFLNAVAGLLKPKSGSMYIDDKKLNGPGWERTVVFQKPSLLPWRSVIKNVIYGLELRGVRKKDAIERARKYTSMVHLDGFEKYYAHQLSGGMQQRVNLARALVCEPEVLLLDEPFAALDAITRETMQNELLELWEKTRKTVLMVTHQIDEAVLLSDRVIIFTARPAKVFDEVSITLKRPRTPDVRANPEFEYLNQKIWGSIHTSTRRQVPTEYEI